MKPFIKTVMPGSWTFNEPEVALVDVHSRGIDSVWLEKRAAAGAFKDLDYTPKKGHALIHLIAMGDDELYGGNRNGDAFKKEAGWIEAVEPRDPAVTRLLINCGNKERHHTFEKYAHVFLHHKNKDPSKSHGNVIKSAHVEPVSRVELMIEVPINEVWEGDIQKLASGQVGPAFSMSCKVPFDVCSYCLHKAASRKFYCDHLKYQMTQITKEGHQIRAINDWMTYFDISKVGVGADRIAFGLMKAAELGGDHVLSGSEIADELMLFPPVGTDPFSLDSAYARKIAALRKLSEMEKQIEMSAGSSPSIAAAHKAAPKRNLSSEEKSQLSSVSRSDIPALLGALADAKIILSMRDFLSLILGKEKLNQLGNQVDVAEEKLPGVFSHLEKSPGDFDDFELGKGVLPGSIARLIERMIPDLSLSEGPARRRAIITVVRAGNSSSSPGKDVLSMGKESAYADAAGLIATAYAKYKVAAFERAACGVENPTLTALTVVSNYAR